MSPITLEQGTSLLVRLQCPNESSIPTPLAGPDCRLPAATLLLANLRKVPAVEIMWAWYKTQTPSPEAMRKLLLAMLRPNICYGTSLNLVGDAHIRLCADGQGHLSKWLWWSKELLSAYSLELPAFPKCLCDQDFFCHFAPFDWYLLCISQHAWLSSSPLSWFLAERDPCERGVHIKPSTGRHFLHNRGEAT